MSDDHFREIEEHRERVTGLEYEASLEDPDWDKYLEPLTRNSRVLDPSLIPTSNGAVNPYRQIGNVIQISVDELDWIIPSKVVCTCRRYSAPYALCPRHGTT